MRWIRSLGGPLILLPHDAVRRWTGAYGPGGEDDWDEEDTEYWRISEEVKGRPLYVVRSVHGLGGVRPPSSRPRG